MGTPFYLAPEQQRGMAIDHRADVYALGVLLYELLVGQVPTPTLYVRPSRRAVDARWDEVLKQALQELPENRYQNMRCFCEAIKSMADRSPALNRLRDHRCA